MKIVCDNCATKYSIADDKVRGKVFKIRCKKCSHIIVVRGQEGAASGEPAPKFDQKETKVFDYSGADGEAAAAAGQAPAAAPSGDTPVWHLVIDREQVGPMTAEEVRQRFARGEVDGETYAWREGFGDWLKLSAIADFADLQAAAPPPADGYGDGSEAPHSESGDLFGQGGAAASNGGEEEGLFSSAPTAMDKAPAQFLSTANSGETPAVSDMFAGAGSGGGLFESPPASHGGGGALFEASAPVAASSSGGSGGLFEAASGPNPRVDASRMTGQRNENSVLFSLSNLQALAVGQQGGGAAAAPAAARPGYANSQTEGSGLIDIRAMAASALGAPTMGAGPAASSSDEELAPFGSFSPVAAPVLMPMAGASTMPKWVWSVVAGGGLLLVVAIVLFIKILSKPQVVMAPQAPAVAMGNAPTTAPQPTPSATLSITPKPEEKKAEEAKGDDKKDAKGAKSSHSGTGKHPANKDQVKKDLDLMRTPTDKGAPPPPAPKKKDTGPRAGGDDLDKLLSGAVGGKDMGAPKGESGGGHEKSSPSAADENLPDQLRQTEIVRGMSGIKPKVQSCYGQYNVPGMVTTTVTINPSGRVSNVQVTGKFAGTPTGTCVAAAVKQASFPRFKGAAMSGIEYPFMLSK